MAPMPESAANENADPGTNILLSKWKAVFSDPTFGGECPPLPTKESLPISRFTPDPIIEDLPPEVSCMVSRLSMSSVSSNPADFAAAGTGSKAAQYLRRSSQDSKNSADSKVSKRSKESTSGLSDSSDEVKRKGSKGSKGTNASSGLSDVSGAQQEQRSTRQFSSEGPAPSGPDRGSRRAETLSPKKEEKDESSGFGSDSDKDLLSNPFATDSEEDR